MAKILVIEKDDSTRSNWLELLSLLKHNVEGSYSLASLPTRGQSLHEFITAKDLVIADTETVGLDALALKGILNNDLYRIPLILVSADNVPECSLDRDELSAVSFLRKPFPSSLLLEFIDKAVKVRELFKENQDSCRTIAKLLITQPNHLPVEHVLSRSYTFGRYREGDEIHADINLRSPTASRKHAFLVRVYKKLESYYKLIDFSSNGIAVNGKKIPKMLRLKHEDEIEFYPGAKGLYTEMERESLDLDVTLTGE